MKYNNPKITSFRDLIIWQKGLAIAKETYKKFSNLDLDNLETLLFNNLILLSIMTKYFSIDSNLSDIE